MDQPPAAHPTVTIVAATTVPEARNEGMSPTRLIGLLWLLGLVIGCLLILRPFISALLWAAILVFSTWPGFVLLRTRLRLSPGVAAGVMVVAEFFVIGLPLVLVAPKDRTAIDGLRESLSGLVGRGLPDFGWIASIPLIGPTLHSYWLHWQTDLSSLGELVQPYMGSIAQMGLSLFLAVLSGIAELLVALVLAFFFYRDGPALADAARRVSDRLAGPASRRLFKLIGDVTRGVVYGLLGTAVVQGLMTALGLWLAGVPQPVLFGVIAGVVSILPVGAPLVWIPATLWLLGQGSIGWGIFMGLYGALGISSVDNFIRPWLISRGADLPLLLTLLGALGGVFAFGFLGLFLGPVLLAVGYTMLRDWMMGTDAEAAVKAAAAQERAEAEALGGPMLR
ncbi:AI-2E family transporter [Humitalea rosea]|uniref:AI-2E family transporter n=1 Tax=Humitalea rosea TaxID=990373 RepID=UPI001FE6D322|nr:AI-2E family transporter [Humitalea rosea]